MTGFPIDHVQKERLMHMKMRKMIGQVLYVPSWRREARSPRFMRLPLGKLRRGSHLGDDS